MRVHASEIRKIIQQIKSHGAEKSSYFSTRAARSIATHTAVSHCWSSLVRLILLLLTLLYVACTIAAHTAPGHTLPVVAHTLPVVLLCNRNVNLEFLRHCYVGVPTWCFNILLQHTFLWGLVWNISRFFVDAITVKIMGRLVINTLTVPHRWSQWRRHDWILEWHYSIEI